MRTYYVHMLRCFDGTFYVGVTNDVDRRYYEHCYGDNKDSYTHSRRPLRAFEKKLKSWTHAKKTSLC